MPKSLARLSLAAVVTLAGCTPATEPPVEPPAEPVQQVIAEAQPEDKVPETRAYEVHPDFLAPWPTEFSVTALAETAMAKVYDFYETEQASKPFRLFIDPDIPAEDHGLIEEYVSASTTPFAPYITDDLDIIVGRNTKFMDRIVEEYGLPKPSMGGGVPCPFNTGACSMETTVWIASQGASSIEAANVELVKSIAHKLTHGIQDGIDTDAAGMIPPRSAWNFRPAWFTEGLAELHAYAVADYLGIQGYRNEESLGLTYLPLRSLEEWEGVEDHVDVYLWGRVGVEYLAANIGMDGILDIYRNLEQGNTFEEAFVKAAEISLDEFYIYFDQWAVANGVGP